MSELRLETSCSDIYTYCIGAPGGCFHFYRPASHPDFSRIAIECKDGQMRWFRLVDRYIAVCEKKSNE